MVNASSRALVVVVLALVVGACGDSSEDPSPTTTASPPGTTGGSAEQQALTTVCGARDDIAKQIETLKGTTPASLDAAALTQTLGQLTADLKDIAGAQPELSDDRRKEIEAAGKDFAASVKTTAAEVVSSLSASNAGAAVTSALQQLESSYEQSFGKVDCG